MATLLEIKSAVTDLETAVSVKLDGIAALVVSLKNQIAEGGAITEANLDEVKTLIDTAKADLTSKEDAVTA